MYRCFFIGHREAPESVYPELAQTVEQLIGQGVTDFYVGHYGNFDRLAARAVIAAKQQHPEVRLTMLLPYHPAAGYEFVKGKRRKRRINLRIKIRSKYQESREG